MFASNLEQTLCTDVFNNKKRIKISYWGRIDTPRCRQMSLNCRADTSLSKSHLSNCAHYTETSWLSSDVESVQTFVQNINQTSPEKLKRTRATAQRSPNVSLSISKYAIFSFISHFKPTTKERAPQKFFVSRNPIEIRRFSNPPILVMKEKLAVIYYKKNQLSEKQKISRFTSCGCEVRLPFSLPFHTSFCSFSKMGASPEGFARRFLYRSFWHKSQKHKRKSGCDSNTKFNAHIPTIMISSFIICSGNGCRRGVQIPWSCHPK